MIGTMSLLRFCYAGRPKRMSFTSSITSCLGPAQSSFIIPEAPVGNDPLMALSTGYAQSKYISKFELFPGHIQPKNASNDVLVERITQTASLHSNLNIPIHILRVGQLCGAIRTGIWNTAEMYPILFATSFHPRMRCIPTFASRSVEWLPIDVAAQTISQLLLPQKAKGKEKQELERGDANTPENTYIVNNIVNPTPIPWSSLLSILQSSISPAGGPLEEISISEWVRRLTALADEGGLKASDLPGLRLLGFFERMADEEEGSREILFETGGTMSLSPALRECGPLCKEWIDGTLKVWRTEGFVNI